MGSEMCIRDSTQAQSIHLLGITISYDLKWNMHFDNLVKKASKRLFVIRNLRRANCPPHLLFRSYTSFIRSLLIYAYPSFCNAPEYVHKKLFYFEKRAFRIMGLDPKLYPSLKKSMDTICNKLFLQITKSYHHPLRTLFNERSARITRSSSSLVQPFDRNKRFRNSFTKYY